MGKNRTSNGQNPCRKFQKVKPKQDKRENQGGSCAAATWAQFITGQWESARGGKSSRESSARLPRVLLPASYLTCSLARGSSELARRPIHVSSDSGSAHSAVPSVSATSPSLSLKGCHNHKQDRERDVFSYQKGQSFLEALRRLPHPTEQKAVTCPVTSSSAGGSKWLALQLPA